MTSRFAFSIFVAASCLLFKASPALSAVIDCPESIVETPSVSINDKIWTVVAKTGERPLEQVGIYQSRTDTADVYGAQVPDSTKTTKRQEVSTWNLVRSPTDTFWVGCSYVGTTAIVLKRLDPDTKKCVATYEPNPPSRWKKLSVFRCQ
ncbi:MAG: hypothetical protein LBE81_12175 [Azonexus sp.]|jgi:hypothetical protein|uniref:STY0301 family protein n=1 Tax=Azonexus sp. TaxID=1872668 RepID=UPI0028198CEE|nr:STY0301 family protein [Azonexus sp.]MDR0777376.1 hypothetical protein [Azonexus sp.]